MNIAALPRNDLKACRAYYHDHDNNISVEEYRVMLDAQDDRAELESMAELWHVTDWLEDLENVAI